MKSRSTDTGREDALRFVSYVAKCAEEERFIMIPSANWPWMFNDKWRIFVGNELGTVNVRDHHFFFEDGFWSFHAKSTNTLPIQSKLSLDESPEPKVPMMQRVKKHGFNWGSFYTYLYVAVFLLVAGYLTKLILGV